MGILLLTGLSRLGDLLQSTQDGRTSPADATLWGSKQARWHPVGAALGGRESTAERGGGSTGDGAASQGGAGRVLTKQETKQGKPFEPAA